MKKQLIENKALIKSLTTLSWIASNNSVDRFMDGCTTTTQYFVTKCSEITAECASKKKRETKDP